MWDPELDDVEDAWEPLRLRRARSIRFLAILVVIAMVLALVIPVLLRSLQDDEPDETRPNGVHAVVVFEDKLTLAFMDIMPMTLGHLLVVPVPE